MENTTPQRVYDPVKGLWYQDIPGKGRVYDSPAAYGQAPPAGGGGALHKNTTWDQNTGTWDQGLDWGKIYAWAIAAGLGVSAATAIANAASVSGPAGASATPTAATADAGLLPSATLPGSSTLGGGMSAGASGGVAAAPSGAVPAAVGAGASAGGTATGNALSGGSTAAKLAAGLGGLFGGKALGNYLNPNGGIPPELTQLLQLSLDRAKSQQPLFNQVNSGVSQMLPNFASPQGLNKLLGGG